MAIVLRCTLVLMLASTGGAAVFEHAQPQMVRSSLRSVTAALVEAATDNGKSPVTDLTAHCQARGELFKQLVAELSRGQDGPEPEILAEAVTSSLELAEVKPLLSPECLVHVEDEVVLEPAASVRVLVAEGDYAGPEKVQKPRFSRLKQLLQWGSQLRGSAHGRRLVNEGVVMAKPTLCATGVNPCAPWRVKWGGNRWQTDTRAYTDDGIPAPTRRRLAAVNPSAAGLLTTHLFDAGVALAAQPSTRRLSVRLAGDDAWRSAWTWGSRALLQQTTDKSAVLGFRHGDTVVLADSASWCRGSDVNQADSGAVRCALPGQPDQHFASANDAWRALSAVHLHSLGVAVEQPQGWTWAVLGMGLVVAMLVVLLWKGATKV